ncbi:MAG: hypothetical protein ACRBF0_12855 [Calditrichia bacterium]
MKNYRIAILAGVGVSVLISGGMALWNWLENPGSIFQTADGTNWSFIWETFGSWFLPLILLLLPIFLLTAYLRTRSISNP